MSVFMKGQHQIRYSIWTLNYQYKAKLCHQVSHPRYGLEDLIVESLWSAFSGRHICRFVVCVELIRSSAWKRKERVCRSFVVLVWSEKLGFAAGFFSNICIRRKFIEPMSALLLKFGTSYWTPICPPQSQLSSSPHYLVNSYFGAAEMQQ